jgi:imidazolonepropionase-like amidohydrolase
MNNDNFAVVVDSWFDGQRYHAQPTTLLVEDGRISSISPSDDSAALKTKQVPVERGDFLMPGLVDAHVHLFLDGATTDGPQRSAHLKQTPEALADAARANARQSFGCGITLVRDAGDRHGINHIVRDEAKKSDDMARVRSAGLGVRRPKRYGAFMAQEAVDNDAIKNTVTELAADSDEIKLILTGIIDFDAGAVTDEPQFDLESARLVVDTAHNLGRKTFAHCSGEKGLVIAANAGVDSIEHGFFMNRETLAVMRDRNIAWTPTFGPVHFQWAHPEVIGWSAQTVDNLRRILDNHAEHLLLADEMGVRLLLGTDAGSMGVDHGNAVFEEINRYLEAGLSLEKTLYCATASAREHFDMPHPLLVEGADFEAVLLDNTPFDDINALRQPRRVWLADGGNL